MIITATCESSAYAVMFLLIFASVGTYLSVGIKLPYNTWYHRPPLRTPFILTLLVTVAVATWSLWR